MNEKEALSAGLNVAPHGCTPAAGAYVQNWADIQQSSKRRYMQY